ncbi:MAG: Na+/H+ antiporter, partial [Sphingobacteriales bacterium]
VTLVARNFITVADSRHPGYKVPFVLGWTGMRGVVSLAAALSIPEYVGTGVPFPQRNLILLITFVVILLTLVIQGLTLPYIIRRIKIPDQDNTLSESALDNLIKKEMAEQGLGYLRQNFSVQLKRQPVLQQIEKKWQGNDQFGDDVMMPEESKLVYRAVISKQREWLLEKNMSDVTLDEDVIRKYLYYLDLEEEKLGYV